MDQRVADPTGEPNSERAQSGADRGERCAASKAFNGSSPTANLVSNIKRQKDVVGKPTPAEVRRSSRETASLLQESVSRSEEHTSELQSRSDLVCRLLLEKKKRN